MKKRFWNVRTKLLLTLAGVVLPAAALIVFGFQHLESIERGHAVEAAIQGDFHQMLTIVTKHLTERAYDLIDTVRSSFPSPLDKNVPEKLDKILADHPWAKCVFLYDNSTGTVFRMQTSEMQDPESQASAEKSAEVIQGWFGMEGATLLEAMRKREKDGEPPYISYVEMVTKGDKQSLQSMQFFPVDAAPKDHVSIGGVLFDPDYLKNEFLPNALNAIILENAAESKHDPHHQPAIMLHYPKESTPIAASSGWDGGPPEVEQIMGENPFHGTVLAIQYPGTTIKAMNQRFLRTSYIILGTLSALMVIGLFFTYRSVTKTMELAKLKSDIVSNVSHELRTPLALIRLYAETLELGRVPNEPKKLEYYRIVRKESERLTALINNILDFSRIEAGKKEYEFRETNLPALVRDTLDSYRYQIEQNGFRYEEHISDDVPAVRVDREAIARSLLNLVNNAIKYSSSEKYLAVSLYRENGSVKLEVADHGIGIPHSEQHKIFDKFYRVCDPMVHENKGSGLGLSLVQHIVHAHHGEISVESTPGQGSKFSIVLPLDTEATPDGASEVKAAGTQQHEVGA